MDPIRVYRADLRLWSMNACLPLLHGGEKKRAARISNDQARHEFVTTRALLRLLLARHTGLSADALEIMDGACGKPTLSGTQDVHFNVSHSGGVTLIAVASAEVGIDIEQIDGDIDHWSVAELVFSSSEIEMLRKAPEVVRLDVFFSLWTRKEAYLKAIGCGFSSNLPAISIISQEGPIEDCAATSGTQAWFASDLPAPLGFKAALVTGSTDRRIEIVDVPALTCVDIAIGHQPGMPPTGSKTLTATRNDETAPIGTTLARSRAYAETQ